MTDDRDPAGTTGTDSAMVQAVGAFWQLPAILFTGWWNLVTGDWLLHPEPSVHGHSPCDRLVVPDPIEETGEHALFA